MHPNFDKWLFSVGIALLVLLSVVVNAWFDATFACRGMPIDWPGGTRCAFVKFFYDWQQLLGGFFAVGAAVAAWVAIHRQVNQAERQEHERNRRKRDAARAMLPLALSGIVDYARNCTDRLLLAYKNRQDNAITKVEWHAPVVPSGAIADLRTMVEASETPAEGRLVARILWRLQIQASRLRSLSIDLNPTSDSTIVTANSIEQFLVDTIEICALASAMFPFARGETEYPPIQDPDLSNMFNAQMALGIHDGLYPKVDQRLERQYGEKKGETGDEF